MCVSCECLVWSCIGLCAGPITRPGESYRVSLRYPKLTEFYIYSYIYVICVKKVVHIAEPSVKIDTL
jgi:hypothetical protein